MSKRILLKRAVKCLFLIGLILSGCDAIGPSAAPTSTPMPQGVELSFETIERTDMGAGTGDDYQGEAPRLLVDARAEEMNALGDTISIAAQEELRKLDFDRYFVIAAFQGLKGTNMYGVEIQRVTWDGDQITVYAHFTERDPELAAAEVNTSPYHIKRYKRAGYRANLISS